MIHGADPITTCSDHYFNTCHRFLRSFPTFQKQSSMKIVFATGGTVILAKWIVVNTCRVLYIIIMWYSSPDLWNVYGECDNFHVIPSAHSGAILELHFSYEDGNYIYTASTDKTVGVFDVSTGARIKRLKGHNTYVNSVHPARRGEPLIVSGSDDCSIKVWDQRKRNAVQSINNTYQVT